MSGWRHFSTKRKFDDLLQPFGGATRSKQPCWPRPIGRVSQSQSTRDLGQPEPELCPCSPEAGLGDIHCSKNPDHVRFIAPGRFDITDLPIQYRKKGIMERIKSLILLAVRIGARPVSKNRPSLLAGSHVPDPLHKFRGENKYRTGSGCVYRVTKVGDGRQIRGSKPCKCLECRNSLIPRKTWWEVRIQTVAHVLFDQSEVEGSEVRFFYDEKNSAQHVAKGFELLDKKTDDDWCRFTVIVHNQNVGDRLERAMKNAQRCDENHIGEWDRKLVAVISHPHGCSKFITIGTMARNIEVDTLENRVTYTTPTCPGSSGGIVIWIDYWTENPGIAVLRPHCESFADGRNGSGGGAWWSRSGNHHVMC